jgi:hypothetical protein
MEKIRIFGTTPESLDLLSFVCSRRDFWDKGGKLPWWSCKNNLPANRIL